MENESWNNTTVEDRLLICEIDNTATEDRLSSGFRLST